MVNQLGLSPMSLGLVYLVFAPAIVTTPLAGRLIGAAGPRRALTLSLSGALAGLALTLSGQVGVVLTGLALIGAATFAAQAAGAGFVTATVQRDRAQANGLYLTSYYLGGLVGALALGQINAASGWPFTAAAIGAALVLAMLIARALDGNESS